MIVKAIVTKDEGKKLMETKYFRLRPNFDEEDFFHLMRSLVEDFEKSTKEAWYWCQDIYGRYHISPCYGTELSKEKWDLRIEFPWDRGD